MKKLSILLKIAGLAILLFLRIFCIGWISSAFASPILLFALQGIWSVLFALFTLFCFGNNGAFTDKFPTKPFLTVLLIHLAAIFLQYYIPAAAVIPLEWVIVYLILAGRKNSFFRKPGHAVAVLAILLVTAAVWSAAEILVWRNAGTALDTTAATVTGVLYYLETVSGISSAVSVISFVCQLIIGSAMILFHPREKSDSDN